MPISSHLAKVWFPWAMILKFSPNVSYGPKYRPRNPHSNGDIGPRKTQKIGFSPKWRRKLLPVPVFTSYSDSPWWTSSITPQISKSPPWHFFEKFDLKVEEFKTFKRVAWISHLQTNAQRGGRPAEYRWRPLFNAAKFGWRLLLECRAVTLPRRESCWKLQGCPILVNRSQPLVGRSSPYYEACGGDVHV